MVFSSTVFLFLYLPAVLFGYFLLPGALRNLWLLLASLFFYFWGENWFVFIMSLSILIDYVAGLMISGGWRPGAPLEPLPPGPRTRLQKAGLVLSLVGNLSLLGFFKYFNFAVDNYNAAVTALGLSGLAWTDPMRVILPLGISFYTFQSMSYTIDVYRGKVAATRRFLRFACFVSMFPQLVAGPIVRYRDVAEQLVHRTVSLEGFAAGVRRFIIGLGKKVLIANVAATGADAVFALPAPDLTPGLAWLGVACYTLQIYFDFSGYSDMAIGMGLMFGFKFPENFNYPYISHSIREFWQRWHMTLSFWFRDYLYIPLGGSRVPPRVYFNLVAVFFLCGLWHGAAWNFVVWGLYHGAFMVLERWGLEAWIARRPQPLRYAYVMLVVMVGWVLFRADTLGYAATFLSAMFGLSQGTGHYYPALYLNNHLRLILAIGALGSTPVLPMLRVWLTETPSSRLARFVLEGAGIVGLALIFAGSAMALAAGTHNPFIYYRF
ncbi:MBOAT family protein [bacterium]|nr:MBOAT family protein [bacterium]